MSRVRDKRPEDVEALHAVWRAAVEATHGFLSPEDLAFFSTFVREQYLPQTPLRVIEDEAGRVVGFAGTTGDMLDALFVTPAAHGRGFGHALLADAFGTGEARVDVNEQNASGRAFYARQGFELEGRSALDGSGRPYPLLHLRRRAGT